MTKVQWRFCMMNVIEDERKEVTKINDCLDFFYRIFVGDPDKSTEQDNSIPNKTDDVPVKDLDVSYTTSDGGREISVRKVQSSEFDKIMNNPEEYRDPKLNLVRIIGE